MNLLEPLVRAAVEQISDPEARSVAERAYKTLKKSAEGAESKVVTTAEAEATVRATLGDKCDADAELSLTYIASLTAMASNMRCFEEDQWKKGVGFIAPFSGVIGDLRAKMEVALKPVEEIEDEDTEGVDLYKGSFSLAYGTLTLLRDTKMHLKRNRFYGLLGPNQCGKTTLMRAIANELSRASPSAMSLRVFSSSTSLRMKRLMCRMMASRFSAWTSQVGGGCSTPSTTRMP
jgi:elongation factor 3